MPSDLLNSYVSGYLPYSGTVVGGYGFSPLPILADGKPVPADAKVKPSEPVKRYGLWGGVAAGWCAPPAYVDAPPFDPLLCGVARAMSMHSTLAFVYANLVQPIVAASYTVEINPAVVGKVPGEELEKRKKVVEAALRPHVKGVVRAACRATQYGRWTQEVVWDRVDGYTVPVRFKTMLPWQVTLMADEWGDFAGVRYGDKELDPRYVYHHVNDPEIDPIFGYSRHQNVVAEWWHKLQNALRMAKLAQKASSLVPVVKGPSGPQAPDETGRSLSGQEVAKNIAAALSRGEPVFMPQYLFDTEAMDGRNPELAKFTAFEVEMLNLGDQGPAMRALADDTRYQDVSMSRGWGQPERAGMEGEHGTKAEAGVHRSVGIEDSESVYFDVMGSLNQQVVDRCLRTNFLRPGSDPAGSVYLLGAQLQDPDKQWKQQLVTTMAGNQASAAEIDANIDKRGLLQQVEVPLRPEKDVAADLEEQQRRQEEQQKRQAQLALAKLKGVNGSPNGNGKPSANGNGKPSANGDGGEPDARPAGGRMSGEAA